MKCKKCNYEGEFKYCPQCGTKGELTVAERLDHLEKRIVALESKKKVQRIVQRVMPGNNTVANMKGKPNLPRKQLMARADAVAEYVKKKGQKIAISRAYLQAIGITPYTQALKEIKRKLMKYHKEIGITKRGNRVYLYPNREKVKKIEKVTTGRTTRIRNINKKASQYIKEGMARKDAFKRAAQEYDLIGKGMIRKKPLNVLSRDEQRAYMAKKQATISYPMLQSLPEDKKQIFRDIMQRVITEKGTYGKIDSEACGVPTRDYLNHLIEIMDKAEWIANYYGVKNKFTIHRIGDKAELRYEG